MLRFLSSAAALSLAAVAAAATLPTTAFADSIPYSHPGTIAAQTTLTASATGEVFGYFVQGGSASGGRAGDTDFVRLFDVTTGTTSAYVFNNQTSAAGSMADFGSVNAGDTLVFELFNQSINQTFATAAAYSADGVNHGYETAFAGGVLNGVSMPAGVFVGMEDLNRSNSDFNYNDDTFVFTNVKAAVTPEPSSLLLLGTGLAGAAGMLRRRLFGR